MDIPDHPMTKYWQEFSRQVEEKLPPGTITLPRGEVLRLCKMMFFQGINTMCLGIVTLDKVLDEEKIAGETRERARLDYLFHTGHWVKKNSEGTLDQMATTIRAHQEADHG